jgi:ferredoxin
MLLQALLFPTTRRILQGTQTTLLGRLASRISVPLLSGRNFHITYLPVNERIEGPSSSFVPEQVLEEIVRASAHHVIIRRCTCRDGNQCSHHPVGLACLLLGQGAQEIDPAVGRHVSVEEAVEHTRRCVTDGLIPFVGRFKADNLIWGVRDRGRLLTVCFCCPCCCIIMNTARCMPGETQDAIVKLKGLSISIDGQRCAFCGTCVQKCFMGALSLYGNEIMRDEARCKGCGTCISVCPNGAVSAAVSDLPAAVADLEGRISSLIDYR